jgi:hypothetical protein
MIKKGPKKLENPNKTGSLHDNEVIIVGNSSNIKDTKWGAMIDKFGTVIRVNKFHTKNYEAHTGSKTDVWVRANVRSFFRDVKEWERQIGDIGEIIICCAPHVARDESQEQLKFFDDLYEKNKVDIISYETINKYYADAPWPDEHKWPSTGLTAIQWAIEKYGKIFIHGFDFFEPHDFSDPYHYYEDCKAGFGRYHIPILEKMCVQKYIAAGQLEFLDKDDEERLFPVQNWTVGKLMDKEYIYSRNNLKDTISPSFVLGRDGRIHGYRNFKESSWSLEGEYLIVKDHHGNPTSVYRFNHREEMFRGYCLKNCTKHFLRLKSKVREKKLNHPQFKNKRTDSVIIVGSSSLVMDNDYGEEIDKFDCVVRLNRFFTKHYEKNIDYSKHVGKKTDIWIRNELTSFRRDTDVWRDEVSKIGQIIIVAPRNVIKHRKENLQKQFDKIYPNNEVGVINVKTIDNIYFQQNWPGGKWPSTGLMAIEHILERFDEVHIYGFDFFGYGKDKATHYYNGKEKIPDWKKYHIAELEHDFAMRYVKAGRLILWKDYLKN